MDVCHLTCVGNRFKVHVINLQLKRCNILKHTKMYVVFHIDAKEQDKSSDLE